MEKSFHGRRKVIISWVVILIAIVLSGNTNTNPISFIERVFKPIKIGSATFHYAGIFPILMIYHGVKGIGEFGRYELLKTKNKRIIATIIVLSIISPLCTYALKISKGMSDDLSAIYYNRQGNNNMLTIEQKENEDVRIYLKVELENCSEAPQEFYINLIIPEDYNNLVVEERLDAKDKKGHIHKKFILKGKEKKRIQATFWGTSKGDSEILSFSSSTNEFEFILFNSKDKVEFIGERWVR